MNFALLKRIRSIEIFMARQRDNRVPTELEPIPYSKNPGARQHYSRAQHVAEFKVAMQPASVRGKMVRRALWRLPSVLHFIGTEGASCAILSTAALSSSTEKNNMSPATHAAAPPTSATVGDEFRRGWRTLLAASIGNGSGLSGLAFYTFGVFILPLTEAFGWARGDVSIASSFLLLGTVISAPIVGSLIDRIGARRVLQRCPRRGRSRPGPQSRERSRNDEFC